MAEGGVGVAFLDGAAGVDQGGGVPVGILQGVQAFIEGAVGVGVPVSEDEAIDIDGAPDIAGDGVGSGFRFQQLPITAEEPIGDGGTNGVGHMSVQCVAAVGDDHHIGGILDLDDLVPGVVDEAVVVFVGGQVAVAVVSRCGGAADVGNFVLLVGCSSLRGAVGGDGVPVADGIVVPGLAVGRGAGDIGLCAVQGAEFVTGELIQGVVGVDLAQRGNHLVVLVEAVAIAVVAVLVAVDIGVGAVDPALVDDSTEAIQAGVLVAGIADFSPGIGREDGVFGIEGGNEGVQ